MEVLFTETRRGQFKIGEQRKVKLGYARNYLLPQKLAVLVTAQQLSLLASIRKKAQKQSDKLKERAILLKESIHDQTLTFEMNTHDDGKLYGSVTPGDVISQLNRNFEAELEKNDLVMEAHVKLIGTYVVKVDLHPEVEINVNLVIKSEESAN